MTSLTIEPAIFGGFVVFERPRDMGVMTSIVFAGPLTECLAFINKVCMSAVFKEVGA